MAGLSAGVGASFAAFSATAVSARATPTDPSHAKTSAEQTAVGERIRDSPANAIAKRCFLARANLLASGA
jgi:hypothetical protein